MRILLSYKAHAEGAGDRYTSLLPIGLCYLNSALAQAGFHSRLANYSSAGWDEIELRLKEERPDILGISQFTHNRFESLKLASLAKRLNRKCLVVLGGPHASCRYNEILDRCPDVDAVVIGEGEETFLEVAKAFELKERDHLSEIAGLAMRGGKGVASLKSRAPLANIDALPVPAAGIDSSWGVDIHRQLEFIITSRGCPASCRFCSSPQFWQRQVRFRSPRLIVDEIKYIRQRFGLLYFSFRDDTFTVDRERVIELCKLLLREKVRILWNCQSRVSSVDEEMLIWMKRAGCECVQFGVESGSARVLRALGKRITPEQVKSAASAVRRAGINLSVYLITGVPGETEEDIFATVKLMESILPHDGQVSPLAFYPGTSLFDDAANDGSVAEDLFERSRAAALPVCADNFTERSTRSLLKALERAALKGAFNQKDFSLQKKLIGYCYATNLMEGEWHEEEGRYARAEREYCEILDREPDNPWGWLALGELLGRMGNAGDAQLAFRKVLALVPAHVPALTSLGELAYMSGKRIEASAYFRRALQLNPFDPTAQKRLKMSGKGEKKERNR